MPVLVRGGGKGGQPSSSSVVAVDGAGGASEAGTMAGYSGMGP